MSDEEERYLTPGARCFLTTDATWATFESLPQLMMHPEFVGFDG